MFNKLKRKILGRDSEVVKAAERLRDEHDADAVVVSDPVWRRGGRTGYIIKKLDMEE